MRRYGEILSAAEQEEEDRLIAEYWAKRKEQDKRLKREESAKKKKARTRRANKVYYAKSVAEAKEQRRLEWHQSRADAKAKREQKKCDAEHAPLFKALSLTETEAQCYYKVADLITTKIVSLLASHGLLPADKVQPALEYLSGVKH